MSLYLSKFGTVTRAQLPKHLAVITDILPTNAVIYKQTNQDRYFVGYPGTNPARLTQTFGGDWIYVGTLEVMEYELSDRGEEYCDPDDYELID